MKFYYENVPQLGNVAVSRHALDRIETQNISTIAFEDVLNNGEIVEENHDITWRQGKGIRIVIINKPEPFRGAKLVKTVFKIGGQASAK